MELLFWLSIGLLAYVYAGYPLVLALVGLGRPSLQPADTTDWPTVTLVISAFHESTVIDDKLRNSLALDYPADRLSITVVSDCSDDGTDDLVRAIDDPRVTLLRMEERCGKSVGLNAAVAAASSDLMVFTDANAMFRPDALSRMAAHFADTSVGVVTGQQKYYGDGEEEATDEGLYWRYELALKQLESRVASLVGGDGAIMALRRDLFNRLDASDLSDYLLPLQIVAAGHRNVYEPAAICFEHGAESVEKEFARKVRIVNRAWRATWKMKRLLNPLRYGWFSVQIWSHKLLRWLAGVFMLTALGANLAIVDEEPVYRLALAAQVGFYVLALLGWSASRDGRNAPTPVSAAFYLCVVNLAGLKGIWESFAGKTYATWTTPRQGDRA